ncbi:MAG: hypothetical protein R3338_11105, partial [Thermoanaerobaculia bacterium]|nr:hypothetical protein [Thermoanaerobaculia bacterium]
MVDEPIHDDSSYYEISITAGQAFLAVVLLIASLAAAFAFGIIVGQARAKEQTSTASSTATIVEEEDAASPVVEVEEEEPFATPPDRETRTVETPEVIEEGDRADVGVATAADEPDQEPVPHVAQILSTTEQEPAESLAARL